MKQEISDVIEKRFGKIDKYLRKTHGRCKPESIHSFRLEVKKLRSFLKMIAINGNEVSIPKRLKNLYRLLGRIRVIQLQRQAILETTSKSHTGIPAHYTSSLETERSLLKKKAKSYIRTMQPLKAKKFHKGIPYKITAADLLNFYTMQEHRLAAIFHFENPDEKSLHEARKIIKSMLYDLPFVKDRKISIRESNQTCTAHLKLLELKMGKFHDISTSVQYLREALKDSYGIREKHILTLIVNQWEKDKEGLKRQIMDLGLIISCGSTKTA